MKKTLQVAAGIVLATAILWVGRLVVIEAAMHSLTEQVTAATGKMMEKQLESSRRLRMSAEARRLEQQQEEADRARRLREQEEAACVIITADGTRLHCP